MKWHKLKTVQVLPISLDRAWDFFSDPRNLSRITPRWLGLTITSDPPSRIYPGLIIAYDITPLLGIKTRWLTEITQAQEPIRFVDEQRLGPYRFWHHQHRFRAVEGGVEVSDEVHYALPWDPISRPANALFVRRNLMRIFLYREHVLTEIFDEVKAALEPSSIVATHEDLGHVD